MSGILRRLSLINVVAIAALGLAPGLASAHSEHDKGRFVAENGKDTGDCKNRFRPCKTIVYATQQAQKGDKVFVASGSYPITSPLELIYLSNGLTPVFGGYSTIDNYQVQDTSKNASILVGVPEKYRDLAQQQGFDVISDTKSLEFNRALDVAERQIGATQSRQADVACEDGLADEFACNNISLVSHLPLADFTTTKGSDIWGHHDLNTGIEYAIMGLFNGVVVVSLEDPENPQVVGKITQQSTDWRDIKVLQYFDRELKRWQSYAYVTADSARVGLTILDLNSLPDNVFVAETDSTDLSAHNVYISNLDYSLNIAHQGEPGLHILGASNFSGAMRTYSLSEPASPEVSFTPTSANSLLYTHDASSVNISDARAETDCVNAVNGVCNVMLDFNVSEVRLWDHTDLTQTEALSTFTYNNASYVHSGWWSEDKNYIFVHDEVDERSTGINTTMYVFDITDLRSPSLAGTWTGPTGAVDHNGFVRGNRYYMSNYTRGLTILDITDPTTPEEAGFFDTYPISNSNAFNGAWGVYPYLPSGLILVSDIQSGLFVLRDETRQQNIGFTSNEMTIAEGDTVDISIQNTAGNSIVSYEIISGSASTDDYVLSNGTLSWAEGDTDNKTISLTINSDTDDSESTESLFIKLMNPTNGATLSDSSIIRVNIPGDDTVVAPPAPINRGSVNFASTELRVLENTSGTFTAELSRSGGSDEALTINYAFSDASQTDISVEGSSITWADGETGAKELTFSVNDDDESEDTETFDLVLSSDQLLVVGEETTMTITILDDDSNQPATANPTVDANPGVDQRATISGNATDPEGFDLTYVWEQIAGPTVEIDNRTAETISFTAPSEAVTFRLTVTDMFGVETVSEITMEPAASSGGTTTPPATTTPPPSTTSSSGGGSIPVVLLMLLSVMVLNRRLRKH